MKILVADDDPTIRRELSEFLAADGHAVRTAADGREAKRELESGSFDVALVDLVMPEATGLDLLHHASSIRSTCALIVVTGHATVDAAVEAMKAGAVDFVVKPFEADALRRTIEGIGEERRARDRLSRLVGSVRSAAEVLDSARRREALIAVVGPNAHPPSGGRTLRISERPRSPDVFTPEQLRAVNAILEEHIARTEQPVVYLAELSALEARHGREDVNSWLRQLNRRCHARGGALVLGAGDASFASEVS
ncbi:MAG TPA: response regulator, partial [Thermoplasmata archaeon]|nr:response regulator [Thermoplasmata archaeon]